MDICYFGQGLNFFGLLPKDLYQVLLGLYFCQRKKGEHYIGAGVVSETTQTVVDDEVLANVEETESKAVAPAIEDDDAEEAFCQVSSGFPAGYNFI